MNGQPLPTEGLKEAVARIIDPPAFDGSCSTIPTHEFVYQKDALSKAEAILALIGSSPLSTGLDAEGWVLVPREPTREMLAAANGALKALIESYPEGERPWRKRRAFRGNGEGYKIPPDQKAACRYSAMLSAAPATVLSGGDMSSVAESAGASLRPGASDSSCQSEGER